jgi:hypothetical protein
MAGLKRMEDLLKIRAGVWSEVFSGFEYIWRLIGCPKKIKGKRIEGRASFDTFAFYVFNFPFPYGTGAATGAAISAW